MPSLLQCDRCIACCRWPGQVAATGRAAVAPLTKRQVDSATVPRDCATVKNITISVDDQLYHSARIVAARNQTNVTALLRGYLTAVVQGKAPALIGVEADTPAEERRKLVKLFEESSMELGFQPSREKTYDR